MAFQIPKQPYSGKIGEVTLGTGKGATKIGGQTAYPFHLFEGEMPNPPKIAMEVWDYDPSNDWPAAAVEPFKEVIASPDAWAKKCVEDYGADIIVLQLKSTDPNGLDRGPAEAAEMAKKVAAAVEVPLILWGTANNQKDEEVLKKIAEVCDKKNVALSPVEEGNHKGVGASALGYGQTIVASSPIDVNLAKQLNILLGNLGVNREKILVDPTTGGLGYGLEYSYSVMERIMMAALTQEDDKLQVPMISNIGNEIWKSKEAGQSVEEAPATGDAERRAILMETVAAVCYLMSGASIVILRHPETVRLVKGFIGLLMNGGSAKGIEGIKKALPEKAVDLAGISPEPNLVFGGPEGGKAAAEKAKPEKPQEKPVEAKPKAEATPAAEAAAAKRPEEEAAAKAKAQEEARVKAEAEAKKKAEEEVAAKAKAEADAKKKAEEQAAVKAKAEAEAKKKAEEEAAAKAKAEADAKAKERDDLQALRLKRAEEREKIEKEEKSAVAAGGLKTASKQQVTQVERMTQALDRIHRRL